MAMKIKLSKDSRGAIADFVDLPGTPPVGIGKTKAEAVTDLFLRLIYDRTYSKYFIESRDSGALRNVQLIHK